MTICHSLGFQFHYTWNSGCSYWDTSCKYPNVLSLKNIYVTISETWKLSQTLTSPSEEIRIKFILKYVKWFVYFYKGAKKKNWQYHTETVQEKSYKVSLSNDKWKMMG